MSLEGDVTCLCCCSNPPPHIHRQPSMSTTAHTRDVGVLIPMIRGSLCLIGTQIESDYNRHDIGLNLLWATIATVIKVMVKCQHFATDRPAAGWLDGLLDGADVSGRTRSQQHHSLVPPDSGCSVSLYYKLPLPIIKAK